MNVKSAFESLEFEIDFRTCFWSLCRRTWLVVSFQQKSNSFWVDERFFSSSKIVEERNLSYRRKKKVFDAKLFRDFSPAGFWFCLRAFASWSVLSVTSSTGRSDFCTKEVGSNRFCPKTFSGVQTLLSKWIFLQIFIYFQVQTEVFRT
jgi:hypothetical protein